MNAYYKSLANKPNRADYTAHLDRYLVACGANDDFKQVRQHLE